jgi:hypothetical protein
MKDFEYGMKELKVASQLNGRDMKKYYSENGVRLLDE